MDKVMVIDEGHCVFQGLAKDAKQYFIDLGFYCAERETTSDFLASVTDPAARRIREGFEGKVPLTPEQLELTFRQSAHFQRVLQDIEEYEDQQERSNFSHASDFETTVKEQK